MEMTKDVFDEYGNYKYPDYSNSQYTHDVSTTGGAMMGMSIEQCKSCKKDWTKCGTCPVMMQWVKEHKHE